MQAAPENIARALENMPDNVKLEDGTLNLLSDFPSQSGLDGSYKSPTASPKNQTSSSQEHTRQNSASPQVSSCCSQKPKAPAPIPAPAPVQNGGSCCGASRPTATNQPVYSDADKQQFQQPTTWNNQSYIQFPTPQMPSWQDQTIHAHGNHMHPTMRQTHSQPPNSNEGYLGMLPPQPQRSMSHIGTSLGVNSPSSLAYSNPMNGLGIAEPSMDPYMFNNAEPFYSAPPGGDPCHDCSCGEDCQCLGCAAHPFNTTTRKHVQEMGAIITSNGNDKNPEVINPYQFPSYQTDIPSNSFPYFMPDTPSMNHGFQPISFDSYSDPSSTLHSGYSSPLPSNPHFSQQLMHPSEYYTLEYPVGLPSACSDVTGSCQCGSDCSCVGCLTHNGHNGISLDVSIPEQPIANTGAQQNNISRHVPHTSSVTSQTSRIPVLDNVSVPCLSPRTLETSMI